MFPQGGSVDQVARILAQPLQRYTFAVVFDTHAVNPGLLPNLPWVFVELS